MSGGNRDQDQAADLGSLTLTPVLSTSAGDGGGAGGDGAHFGHNYDPIGSQDSLMGAGDGHGGDERVGNYDYADTGSADQYGRSDERKLFIGGLSWDTTEKDLKEYFSKYGGIESLTLKKDAVTGRSRGFAFIVFTETSSLDNVSAAGDHVLQGKKIDPKKAVARSGKIFVGGLNDDMSEADIKNYFSQFGNVVEVQIPMDKAKDQRKNFCFITFDKDEVVHELLKTPKQTIKGYKVDVKRVQSPNYRDHVNNNNDGLRSTWGGHDGCRGGHGGVLRGRGGGRGRGAPTTNYYGHGVGQSAVPYGGHGYGSSYPSYGGYSSPSPYANSGYESYYGGGYAGYEGYGHGYDGFQGGSPVRAGTRLTPTRGGLNLQGDTNNDGGMNRGTYPTDRRSSTSAYSRPSGPLSTSTPPGFGHHNNNNNNNNNSPQRSINHLDNWRSPNF